MSQSCQTKSKIKCIETEEIFDSAMQVEKKYGYANSNIIACCQNKLLTAYGYHWQYLDK